MIDFIEYMENYQLSSMYNDLARKWGRTCVTQCKFPNLKKRNIHFYKASFLKKWACVHFWEKISFTEFVFLCFLQNTVSPCEYIKILCNILFVDVVWKYSQQKNIFWKPHFFASDLCKKLPKSLKAPFSCEDTVYFNDSRSEETGNWPVTSKLWCSKPKYNDSCPHLDLGRGVNAICKI